MNKYRRMIWGMVALAGLALLVAVGQRLIDRDHTAPIATIVPFSLTDHNGEPITQEALLGKPAALFFGFTQCPEICPTSMYELQGIKQELEPEAADLKAYFVTLDPERDTQDVLKDYVGAFGPFLTGITGSPAAIKDFADQWRVYAKKVKIGDSYTVDHTADIFLMDRAGNVVGTIGYGESKPSALNKIRGIL